MTLANIRGEFAITPFVIFCFSLLFSAIFTLLYQESKINTGVRSIFCVVEKAEKAWWKKLLRGDGKTPHYIKVDWDKWVDEDDANGVLFLLQFSLPLFRNFFG